MMDRGKRLSSGPRGFTSSRQDPGYGAARQLSSGASGRIEDSKYSRGPTSASRAAVGYQGLPKRKSSVKSQENSRMNYKAMFLEKKEAFDREIESLKSEDEKADQRIQQLKREIASLEQDNRKIRQENNRIVNQRRSRHRHHPSDLGGLLAHLDQHEGNMSGEERSMMIDMLRAQLNERLMMSQMIQQMGFGIEPMAGMEFAPFGLEGFQMEQFEDPDNPNVDNMSYEQLLELGDRIGKVSKGFSQEELGALKGTTLSEDLKESDGSAKACAICQSELVKGEVILKLGCSHEYHLDCINNWFEMQKKCPTCMAPVELSQLS